MLKYSLILFLLTASAFFSFPSYAQLNANSLANRTVAVSGEAEIRVVPDQVLLSMTAESRGTDLLETKIKNDKTVAGLVKYATDTLKIEPRHVQTDFISIEPAYRQCHYKDELEGKCNPLDVVYYSIKKGVQFRLNDLTKYENLITKSLQLGVTRIDKIQFITTELRKHRDKARELAAIAAQAKAHDIAKTLGVTIIKPITINAENSSYFYWHGSSQRGQNTMSQNYIQQAPSHSSGDSNGALALGQMSISAKVRITYEIQ